MISFSWNQTIVHSVLLNIDSIAMPCKKNLLSQAIFKKFIKYNLLLLFNISMLFLIGHHGCLKISKYFYIESKTINDNPRYLQAEHELIFHSLVSSPLSACLAGSRLGCHTSSSTYYLPALPENGSLCLSFIHSFGPHYFSLVPFLWLLPCFPCQSGCMVKTETPTS